MEIRTKPVPKERPRKGRNGIFYTPRKTKAFEKIIRTEYQKQDGTYHEGEITAYIEIEKAEPTSWSNKRKRENLGKGCLTRPDLDNIAKAILDALNGIAYKDDSQVTTLIINKSYGENDKIIVNLY